jgi:hypothetical protein
MRYLMVAIIALLVPAAAMAKGECKADKKKFCADFTEKADIKACLDQHMAELSQECKTELEARAKKRNAEGSAKMGKEESTHAQPEPVCFDESCKEK